MLSAKCAVCGTFLDKTDRADLFICHVCGIRHTIPESDCPSDALAVLNARCEHIAPSATPEVAALLLRAYVLLDDKDWYEAIQRCDRILDIDPTCGDAYLARAMAMNDIPRRSHLLLTEKSRYTIHGSDGSRAIQYGVDLEKEYKDFQKFCVLPRKIKQKADAEKKKENAESARSRKAYAAATELVEKARATANLADKRDLYREAQKQLKTIPNHKDAATLLAECDSVLTALTPELIKSYQQNIDAEAMYDRAVANMQAGDVRSLEKAIERFKKLGNYRDATTLLARCEEQLDLLLAPIRAEQAELERQAAVAAAEAAAQHRAYEEWQAACRAGGRCQHCGGTFKGFWTSTCQQCGKAKDY